MPETFRLRRSVRFFGAFSLAFCVCALAGSVAGMLVAGCPFLIIAFAVATLSFFSGLSLWILVAGFRESVTVSEDAAHFTGVLKDTTIARDAITTARWNPWRPSSLKLLSRDAKQMVWFDSFRPDDHRRLMRRFRDWLPAEVQVGWDESLEEQMRSADYRSFFRKVALRFVLLPMIFMAAELPKVLTHPPPSRLTGSPFYDWALLTGGFVIATFAALWLGSRFMEWVERPRESG